MSERQELMTKIKQVKEELGRFIVGQEDVTEQLLLAIFAGGHALLEGLPGLGKTMLVRKISEVMELSFSRIQFTPDLMPADITGTKIIQPDEDGRQSFVFHEGPIFSNIVLADEINRATQKTQSALLEAMQEHTVTSLGEVRELPQPFFVLATQNPLELDGTYQLPEAQLDRFLVKIDVDYPNSEELKEIVKRTTGSTIDDLNPIVNGADILEIRKQTRELLVADDVLDFAVELVMNTHPNEESAPESVKKYVRYGTGPRGLQALIMLAKVKAYMNGRYHVAKQDIASLAIPVLRHRLFLNFEGEATEMTSDELIADVINLLTQEQKA